MKKSKSDNEFKRPYGVAVLEITPTILSLLIAGETYTHPKQMAVYTTQKEEIFHKIHKSKIYFIYDLL